MRRCLNCMNIYEKEYDVCPHCGHVYDTKPDIDRYLPPGTVLSDRYILGTVIGSGGFGITYIAWDNLLKTKVAIKEYFPNTIAGRTGSKTTVSVMGEEQTKQYHEGLVRFLDEARRIAKFNKSENIVHVHDFVETNNTAYMVMEFVEGRTLKTIIEEKKRLPVSEAITIVCEVADILDKVHKEGLLHRDISPDNISIQNDGSVTLLDFGAARVYAEKETKKLSVILKPSYAPPEQYLYDNKQDKRTDVYALGAVLYHMITGKKPQEATGRLMEDNLLRPSEINKEVPIWLDACVLRAMCIKADDRFKDMAEFKDSLKRGGIVEPEDDATNKPEATAGKNSTYKKAEKEYSILEKCADKIVVDLSLRKGTKENKYFTKTIVSAIVILIFFVMWIAFINPALTVKGLNNQMYKLSEALPYYGFEYGEAKAYIDSEKLLVLKVDDTYLIDFREYADKCRKEGFDDDVSYKRLAYSPYKLYYEGNGTLYKIKLRYKSYAYTDRTEDPKGRMIIVLKKIAPQ